MFVVSNEYLTALKRATRLQRIKGTVGSEAFTSANILRGSFSISNNSSEQGKIKLGSVAIGQLKGTFRGMQLDPAEWKGKSIKPYAELKVGNSWIEVPMGEYFVSEANLTQTGITVTAYDAMSKFDKQLPFDTTFGDPYDYLMLACEDCGVELGMTEAEVMQLTNGYNRLPLYSPNDLETWRDLLSEMSVVLCAFCTINREGKLILVSMKGTVPSVDEIADTERFTGVTFSSFDSYFSAMRVTNLDGTDKVYAQEGGDGLTMDVGRNPFLQGGNKGVLRKALFEAICTINYRPFNFSIMDEFVYDLGDRITFSGGIAPEDKVGMIMSRQYTFGKESRLQGFGENPALSKIKTKSEKEIYSIASNQSRQSIVYESFTNAEDINVGAGGNQTISSIFFATTEDTEVIFQLQANIHVVTDGTVATVTYHMGDEEVLFHPKETWDAGDHLLTLMLPYPVAGPMAYNFIANINVTGAVSIAAGDIQSVIWGQGIAADSLWDGMISLEDKVGLLSMPSAPWTALELSDELLIGTQVPSAAGIPEQIPELQSAYSGMTLANNYTEEVLVEWDVPEEE